MRIIVGALWLILFVVLFAFAVNNTAATELHFFAGMSVKAPLIAILLAFFVGGFAFGFIALMPAGGRQRVALRRLRRNVTARPAPAAGPGRARTTPVETVDEIQSVAHVARTTN